MIAARFYTFNKRNNSTKKPTGTYKNYNVDFKGPVSILTPVIRIHDSTFSITYNYCYIPTLGRYYFVTDVRSVGNNRYEVDAKTDVLSTWKSQIRSNTAVIRRQQKKYNLYLDDPDFHVLNYERIQTLQFPISNGFNKTLQYVIVTNGAGNSNQLERSEKDGDVHIS